MIQDRDKIIAGVYRQVVTHGIYEMIDNYAGLRRNLFGDQHSRLDCRVRDLGNIESTVSVVLVLETSEMIYKEEMEFYVLSIVGRLTELEIDALFTTFLRGLTING